MFFVFGIYLPNFPHPVFFRGNPSFAVMDDAERLHRFLKNSATSFSLLAEFQSKGNQLL